MPLLVLFTKSTNNITQSKENSQMLYLDECLPTGRLTRLTERTGVSFVKLRLNCNESSAVVLQLDKHTVHRMSTAIRLIIERGENFLIYITGY